MRIDKRVVRKSLKGAAWLFILALCFSLVFTLVLTFESGIFGDEASPLETTEAVYWEGDGEKTYGTANPIQSSVHSSLNVAGLTQSTPTKWTYTVNAPTTDFDVTTGTGKTTASPKNFQIYKQNGNTTLVAEKITDSSSNNQFRIGVGGSPISAYNFAFATCYEAPKIITELIKDTHFTVTAKISFRYVSHTDWIGEKLYYKSVACNSSSLPTADDDFTTDNGYSSVTVTTPECGNDVTVSENKTLSKTVTLSTVNGTANNCISLALGFSFPKHGTGLAWATGHNRLIVFDSVKIEYTATAASDGAAPILTKKYVSSASETYKTYAKDDATGGLITDSKDLPVYYTELGEELNGVLDSVVADGTGGQSLTSYTNTPCRYTISVDGSDKSYYKYAYLQFNDTCDYTFPSNATFDGDQSVGTSATFYKFKGIGGYNKSGSSWSTDTTSTQYKVTSGIATVKVGSTTFNMNGTSGTDYGNVYKAITGGYAKVTKSNKTVYVYLYMTSNASVTVTVTDGGGLSTDCTTTFSGIDTTAPYNSSTSNLNMPNNDYAATSASTALGTTKQWFREATAKFDTTVGSDSGVPRLWFYTVQKGEFGFDGLNAIGADTFLAYRDLHPIAFKTFSSFSYDFKNGGAKGYGSSEYNVGNPASSGFEEMPHGSGYYLFSFYAMDVAGNKATAAMNFYVKVDCDKPEYKVDFSYIDSDGDTINILPAENPADNGKKWATGQATLKLVFDKVNISGNTIVFTDNEDTTHVIVIYYQGTHPLAEFDGVKLEVDYATFGIETLINPTNVTATYSPLEGAQGGAELIFTFQEERMGNGDYPNVAWVTEFTVYAGQWSTLETIENQDARTMWKTLSKDVGSTGSDNLWGGKINILIDRNAPDTPIFDEQNLLDGTVLKGSDGYSLSLISERKWYTAGYELTPGVTFEDDVTSSEKYGDGVRVVYGVLYISTQAELDALWDTVLNKDKFLSEYKKDGFSASTYFAKYAETKANSFDDPKQLSLDLVKAKNGGMRLIYAWAIDQAGNCSDVNLYYILADQTTYTVNASFLLNDLIGGSSTGSLIAQRKGTGEDKTTSFKRGDVISWDLNIASGYVPYLLTMTNMASGDVVTVLNNYTPISKWSLNKDAEDTYEGLIDFENINALTYTLDRNDNLASLPTRMTFDFSHRQVVGYTISSGDTIFYNSAPVSIAMTYTPESAADKVASHFKFVYIDSDNNVLYMDADGNPTTDISQAKGYEEGNPQYYYAIYTGEYRVRIYIPKNDPSYITDDYKEDGEGGQTFDDCVFAFTVAKGVVTVTTKPTNSIYGDIIVLDCAVDGFNAAAALANTGEELRYTLKLKTSDGRWTPYSLLDVASYEIIADTDAEFGIYNSDGSISENYTVEFVNDNKHTVKERDVKIATWTQSKEYGDNDPIFKFGVATNQFGWYTGRGGSYTVANLLSGLLGNSYEVASLDGVEYYLYNDTFGAIGRTEGENVLVGDGYAYNVDATLITLGNNYNVSALNTQKFVIVRRTVVLDVSGQFTELSANATPDPSSIVPDYILDDSLSEKLRNEIKSLLAGKLYLDSEQLQIPDPPPSDYSRHIGYLIMLDPDANTRNIEFVLGDDNIYIVYFLSGSAILIKYVGEAITYTYGVTWDPSMIVFDKTKFSVESEDEVPDFDGIKWDLSISGVDAGAYIPFGTRRIVASNVKLTQGGEELSNVVTVSPFNITVNAAVIVIRPTASSFEKTYGDDDTVLGIDFEIVSVNGVEFTDASSYAGVSYATLYSQIKGSFARAQYNNGGTYSIGGKFSPATDVNGYVRETDGDYYSFAVRNAFSCDNTNFSVTPQNNTSARFYILQKTIELDVTRFVGVSRSYTSDTNVNYGDKSPYDLASAGQLVRPQDNVTLTVDAEYTDAGSLYEETKVGIILSGFALAGNKDDVRNYRLSIIRNHSEYSKLFGEDGAETDETDIAEGVYAIIYYIDNIVIDENNHIKIYMGTIALYKSDFAISKQYDHTTVLDMSAVTVKNRSVVNEDGTSEGSTMLYNIWNAKKAVIVGEAKYSGVLVSNNYLVTITLFFPLSNASGLNVKNLDSSVSVTTNDEGITVSLTNIQASIVKRVLGVSAFAEIKAVDRAYNAKATVSTEYVYATGALAVGDDASSVGLTLMAKIDGSNFGQGEHAISFVSVGESSSSTTLKNNNYTIDIDALNNYYSANRAKKVNISRAKLIPNVDFLDKDYDGSEIVETAQKSELAFRTLEYFDNLKDELAMFRIEGTPMYLLSAYGEINENVALDAVGNIIPHNVMVRGLQIVEEGSNYLKNYEIYGVRYIDDSYTAVGSVVNGEIDDFEILGAVTVNKKELSILVNNVLVKEKVYDGTNEADIQVLLGGSGIVNGHEDHIEVKAQGKFTKINVSDNVEVVINNLRLVWDEEAEGYYFNYTLKSYTERRSSSIVPRPVGVNININDKTYDGATKIPNNLLDIKPVGLMGNDENIYAVQAGGNAYYIDKNVATDKVAAIFNPVLKSNTGASNYVLMYDTDEYEGEGYIAYLYGGELHYKEKISDTSKEGVTYYYPLPTTNKYILKDDANAAAALEANAVIGSYVVSIAGVDTEVYAVKSSYNGAGCVGMAEVSYLASKGNVTKKKVYISPTGIKESEDTNAFRKMFDGTDTFFGVKGIDFYYTAGSISGVIPGDDVEIGDIVGKFDKADTTANYVVFTALGITGNDVNNYCIDETSTSARRRGYIIPRTINSYLADADNDGTMYYGDNANSVVGKISYSVLGNDESVEYPLDLWQGGLYMSFADYCAMMGYGDDDYKTISLTVFVKEGNSYVASEIGEDAEDMSKYYIMLSSITSLPTAKAEFTVSKPSAGASASSYRLVGGVATNYKFKPIYTGDGSSLLTVTAKDLFIAIDGVSYTKVYGEGDQSTVSVNLLYLDKDGNNGIAPSETAVSIFRMGGKYIYPVAKIGIYDLENGGDIIPIGEYPLISEDLALEKKVYVIYFEAPQGIDDYSDVITNYIIHLGDGVQLSNDRLIMTYDNFELKTAASTLTLELPRITDVSLAGGAGNTYSVTYDGTNLTGKALTGGVKSSDRIYILKEDDTQVLATDANTYVGYIVLERDIESGDHNYKSVWRSPSQVTIQVGTASPQLVVNSSSKYYDGKAFAYTLDGGDNMIEYAKNATGLNVRNGYAEIEYYKQLPGGKLEKVNEMKDAATYLVKVSFNDTFFEANNRNYTKETAIATYTILRAVVNVNIVTDGYKVDQTANGDVMLGAVYDKNATYDIDYTVSMDVKTPANIKIDEEDTRLVFSKDITGSGRYNFKVEIADDSFDSNNYVIMNGSGVLELTTTHVQTVNASVELSKDTVADRIVAHEVYDITATANDVELWSKIEEYMPSIHADASLAAVVRLSLYYGTSIVSLNGSTATVEVLIPENVKDMKGIAVYTVNENGGLTRLTDYDIKDGKLTYTTDYLGALVFVDLNQNSLPLWAIILIIVGCGAVALTLAVTVISLIVRKSKLKKLV